MIDAEIVELALRRIAAQEQDSRIDVRLVRIADEIAKMLKERNLLDGVDH